MEQYTGRGTTNLMEDGTSSHTAKITKALHHRNGLIQIKWPANSPDFNPIKSFWHLLKYQVSKQFPKTDEEVRQYIEEEWKRMQLGNFKKYIDQIHDHCEAVILANGGHAKW